MATRVLTQADAGRIELDELDTIRLRLPLGASARLMSQPPDSDATLTASGGPFAPAQVYVLRPDRWGTYRIHVKDSHTLSYVDEFVLDLRPFRNTGDVLGFEVGLPVAGVFEDADGDSWPTLYLSYESTASDWYAYNRRWRNRSKTRGYSTDNGAAFEALEPAFAPLGAAGCDGTPSGSQDLLGFGKIRQTDGGTPFFHDVSDIHQSGSADDPVRLALWVGEDPVQSTIRTWGMRQLFAPLCEDGGWQADAFDGYQLSVLDETIEPTDDGDRLVLAMQGDLTGEAGGSGANAIRILHAELDEDGLPGPLFRPDCTPVDDETSSPGHDRFGLDPTTTSACDPFGLLDASQADWEAFWDGFDKPPFKADTPWFVPYAPGEKDLLRLVAHVRHRPDSGHANGWASWRRPLGGGEDEWVYEGVFLDLDEINDTLRETSGNGFSPDDTGCLMGDQSITGWEDADGDWQIVQYHHLSPVFRAWWPFVEDPDQTVLENEERYDIWTEEDIEGQLADFNDFLDGQGGESLNFFGAVDAAEGGEAINADIDEAVETLSFDVGAGEFDCRTCLFRWEDVETDGIITREYEFFADVSESSGDGVLMFEVDDERDPFDDGEGEWETCWGSEGDMILELQAAMDQQGDRDGPLEFYDPLLSGYSLYTLGAYLAALCNLGCYQGLAVSNR